MSSVMYLIERRNVRSTCVLTHKVRVLRCLLLDILPSAQRDDPSGEFTDLNAMRRTLWAGE